MQNQAEKPPSATRRYLPGATIGVIGGGQLARMMILDARPMGYRFAVMSPKRESAALLADHWIEGELDDVEAAGRLAEISDVITIDSEHIPASLLERLESSRPVRPSSSVLRIIQDRKSQRGFLERIGAPQPRCVPIDSLSDLEESADSIGYPCVLKTRQEGYDGKGQAVIQGSQDLAPAWERIGAAPAMLEAFVPYDCEVSVLLARRPSGEMEYFPIAHNTHRHHILATTMAPAPVPSDVADDAMAIAGRIAEALDHVGMMAVEMFVVGTKLLVNEIAPRPHNSGHYTFGACATSQFEQHVRAVAGMPLGDPTLLRPAATVNLLGDLWREGDPDWDRVLQNPKAHLHLYDKAEARPGRKMGHLLVIDSEAETAARLGETILDALERTASD